VADCQATIVAEIGVCFGEMFNAAVFRPNPDELASLGDFECSDVFFS
jgi:hypothetical protein